MLKIRKGSEGDISIIKNIAYKTWPLAYKDILSEDQLKYMLRKFYSVTSLFNQMTYMKHNFIIAEDENGSPVGFASFSPHADNPKIFHLHKLYVIPGHQKAHAGATLLEDVRKRVKASGAKSLQLNVNRHNSALEFYKKMGFAVLCEENIDIGSGYFMNDYVLEKPV